MIDLRAKLEVHFYQQDEAAIFLEVFATDQESEKFGEMLLATNLACRMISNLGNGPVSASIAEMLWSIAPNVQNIAEKLKVSEHLRVSRYTGSPGRKRFLIDLRYSKTSGVYKFHLKPKGFGMFGASGLEWYAPMSIVLLLQHLVEKRKEDEAYLRHLGLAVGLCGTAFKMGNIGLASHNHVALELVYQSLDAAEVLKEDEGRETTERADLSKVKWLIVKVFDRAEAEDEYSHWLETHEEASAYCESMNILAKGWRNTIVIEGNCPHCDHCHNISEANAGKKGICGNCNNIFGVPQN